MFLLVAVQVGMYVGENVKPVMFRWYGHVGFDQY